MQLSARGSRTAPPATHPGQTLTWTDNADGLAGTTLLKATVTEELRGAQTHGKWTPVVQEPVDCIPAETRVQVERQEHGNTIITSSSLGTFALVPNGIDAAVRAATSMLQHPDTGGYSRTVMMAVGQTRTGAAYITTLGTGYWVPELLLPGPSLHYTDDNDVFPPPMSGQNQMRTNATWNKFHPSVQAIVARTPDGIRVFPARRAPR